MTNYSNSRYLSYLLAFIAFCIIVFPTAANALTLTPVRFELRGDPGQTLSEEMLLINENDTPETFYASYSNFEAQGDSGTPAFVEPVDDLGTWISTDIQSINLAPRQQKIIPFKINIPYDAEPGGHFAVIFWGTSPSGGNGQVSIGAKTGLLVLLSVNGDVKESAGLLNFNLKDKKFFHSTLPISFEYRFKNDGGDRIKPQGVIRIRNTVFLPTEKINANPTEGNILPDSTRKFNIDWVNYQHPADYVAPTSLVSKFWSNVTYQWKNFAVGLYSAHLKVSYGKDATTVSKTAWFFVFPWQLVLVLVIIFSILFWGGRKLIKRYNRYIIDASRVGNRLPPEPFNDKPSF